MSRSSQTDFNPRAARRRGRLAAIMTALLLAAVAAGIAAGTSVAGKAKVIVTLGSTATTPNPSCPESPCQAIGSVTGFQVSTSQGQLPFRVPHDGKVKFWTLTLSQPTPSQRSFFNGFFGTPPEARLAILRKVPGTSPPRYNLRSQGSIHVLSPYLGQTVKFSANLRVHKGDVVGLTVPTWAPAFSQGLPSNNSWRASREAGKCVNSTDVRQGEPQQKVGKRAVYGCRYTTARLLYTATVVED
jgi:hypothetical protein